MSAFPVDAFEFEDDTVAVVEVTRSGPVRINVDADQADDFLRTLDHGADG